MKRKSIPRLIIFWLIYVAASFSASAERLPIKIFTAADGLGSSYISSMMIDSRGFLWVCTRDGLSRFDGSRFLTYQVGDKNGPPGIEQILESSKGIYWIATTGGLFRFDPNAPPTITDSGSKDRPTLNAEFVSSERGDLYEDYDGNLWMGGSALYRLTDAQPKPILQKVDLGLPLTSSKPFGVGKICEGEDRSLWLLTSWGPVRRLPSGQEIFYNFKDVHANPPTSILRDRDGLVWIGSAKGVYIIRPESRDELSSLGMLTVRDLDQLAHPGTQTQDSLILPEKSGEILKYPDPEGKKVAYDSFLFQTGDRHVWVSNSQSVMEIDGRTFKRYSSAQGFVQGVVQFAEDGSGNLWMAGAYGLARLDRHGLTSYFLPDGLTNTSILAVNNTRDGKLYVMPRDLSLSLFDGRTFQTTHPALPLGTRILWTAIPVFQDSTGEWWFLTDGKLYRFAATSDFRELARQHPLATYDRHDGLSGDSMFHLFEDSHADLWISTHGNQLLSGLSRWDRATGRFHAFTEAEGFPSNRAPSSFAEDKQGNIFVGFYEGGLVRYFDGRFTAFTEADGLPGGLITALCLDQQGRLWIGSAQNGLSRIDEPAASHPRFVKFTAENGMASNNVRSITEDAYGNIYAGTARGIDRLSPDGIHIKHYSTSDGLAGDFVSTAFRDTGGGLWFGTPNGLSRLLPVRDRPLTPPPVWLSGLRIAGERRAVSELGNRDVAVPDISHSQNNLQIDFLGIDFSAGEALRYQYRLDGADRDWSAPTEQRTVTYANLQPGKYVFQVRAVNADGLTSAAPATVRFTILAPIWLRWWFVTLAVLFAIAIFVSLYRYRLAHLKQMNTALTEAKLAEENLRKAKEERLVELEGVRKRIATDLHDDIGSSLTRISLLSEVTQRQGHQVETPAGGSLAVIAGLSRELVDAMSDIVWAINPEKDSLGDLTQRMRHFASDVYNARGIDFRFRFPDSRRDLRVGANVRRELFLIFKEAVNNTVRHSGCTEAEIAFQVGIDGLYLELSDNGRGFDVGNESNGHGLKSMRARTEALGGNMTIAANHGGGTALTFTIPMTHQEGAAPQS